ncbi:pectate lyase family protein [Streptomyces profundus]|uniref:pectate lyase family protein n=1 Tax=Streptomyces profundus TaxID=2867410 RepID=UPI001D16867B|nr:pectate lyase [Streptomyces sp. MA3_2.13]UED83528.1 pectate lyase [Streptomyces sp. MA3_2.13]
MSKERTSHRRSDTRSDSGPAGRSRLLPVAATVGCAALALVALPPHASAEEASFDELTSDAASTASFGSWPGSGHRLEQGVLPARDGWGSAEGGVTGGSGAPRERVFTVTDRGELADALAAPGDGPRIIRVQGAIDANTDADGNALSCEDYATDGYSLDAYLDAYDPDTWGRDEEPSGPQEDARLASAAVQKEQVVLSVPSHTTIVGAGSDARLLGATLDIRGVENVIVRNLTFEDTFDCFPQWDPTDGEFGEWNSEYDSAVVYGSRHVWVDHNTFTDGRRPDADQPRYFGRLFQQHDGQLDIVRGADLVTVSWNVFTDHDKTILLGNSDGAAADDRGKLRTTFHHNLFHNVNERAPRVRYGQVDVYNNHYRQDAGVPYGYSWGIGIESALVAEYNAFTLPAEITPDRAIYQWTANTGMTEHGNRVNGRSVDLLGAFQAANPEHTLGDDAGWRPELRRVVHHPLLLPLLLDIHAGAGRL